MFERFFHDFTISPWHYPLLFIETPGDLIWMRYGMFPDLAISNRRSSPSTKPRVEKCAQTLRMESAGKVWEHAWGSLPSRLPVASSPRRALPRLCQAPLIPYFPLSTFPLKKLPGVTSESAGQARQRLMSYSQALLPNPTWGCLRAHCTQCYLQIQSF